MEFILAHEHPLVRSPGVWEQYPQTVDRKDVVDRIVNEFKQARDAGITAIVDVTTLDLGREVALVQAAADAAGMRIVHPTGIWLDIPAYFAPRWGALPEGTDDIVPLFLADIREGVAGTGIRAGVIKLASEGEHVDGEGNLVPKVARVFRAGAIAGKETGTPVTTHTDGSRATGLSQIAVFEAVGISPGQVALGHTTSSELPYLLEVLERGYYLSMDTFGYLYGNDFEHGVANVAELCRRGWSHRVMLSHDHTAYSAMGPVAPPAEVSGWLRIPNEVAPALERAGIGQSEIEAVCGGSARTFFKL